MYYTGAWSSLGLLGTAVIMSVGPVWKEESIEFGNRNIMGRRATWLLLHGLAV